jgi:two-component sensor histidine kinase
MKTSPGRLRRETDRLGFRLGLLLSLALLPLGLIAIVQTASAVRESEGRAKAALLGETLLSVETQLRVIQRARGLAEALAVSFETFVTDAQACNALMQAFTDDGDRFSLVAFVPLDGQITCNSVGRPLNVAEDPVYQQLLLADAPRFAVNPRAPAIFASVISVSYPVRTEDGEQLGIISVNLPHAELYASDAAASEGSSAFALEREGAALVTFNRQGDLLSSSRGPDATTEFLPRDRALPAFIGPSHTTFTAMSYAGVSRVYAVVPLIEGELYALSTWPIEAYRTESQSLAPSILFPTLMWIVSLLVAWFGAARLASRPIRRLRAAITAFAAGDHRVTVEGLDRAPLEIRELGQAFKTMKRTIIHDKAELENAIHQKEVLLREVHHRVKNNLQLIASIMNMQMRQARSEEAKWLMHGLRDRVMSLATIHRGLYQTTGLTDIRADELLSDILRQVVKMGTGPGRRFQVTSHFEPIRLTPDQAVPLALLLTEALTNALKYAQGPNGSAAALNVTFEKVDETSAQITIKNSTGAGTAPPAAHAIGKEGSTGLGSQLLGAFATQVGGSIETSEQDGEFCISVTFELRPLNEGEDRNAPSDEAAQDDAAAGEKEPSD